LAIIGRGLIDPKAFERTRQVDVTVTSSQILALNATPQTLVAAPGADLALIFMGAMLKKAAGTAYAAIHADDDIVIRYTGSSGLVVGECEATGFLDQTTAQFRWVHAYSAASAESQITPVADAVLVAHMLNGEVTTGNSDITARVFYLIVPTV